jgi:hypothetical protein
MRGEIVYRGGELRRIEDPEVAVGAARDELVV